MPTFQLAVVHMVYSLIKLPQLDNKVAKTAYCEFSLLPNDLLSCQDV